MLYRGEIVVDNRVKFAQNYKATHPKQVIRRLLAVARNTNIEYMTVYVINDDGQVWVYAVTKRAGGTYVANLTHKSNRFIPMNIVNSIFAGNTMIREVV